MPGTHVTLFLCLFRKYLYILLLMRPSNALHPAAHCDYTHSSGPCKL